ncbi:septal ring lytic transglycosylase RlpA family protein [Pendulispora rubella]|uniref:Septal ring lytic transglycosylase RlpA family protein n=1 Tax=Pendulispora rubella TaxID=2741070 RepID=A0ABZ2KU19_9BACT
MMNFRHRLAWLVASSICIAACSSEAPDAVDEGDSSATEQEIESAAAAFSCSGSVGTKVPKDGNYYITAFGCWVDANGKAHGDSGDNCIPACLSQLRSKGICSKNWSGKTCEQKLTWFTADAARYGCGARVKITNKKNGKAAVAVVIDQGPACWVERGVKKAVLDASGRVNRHLFGEDKGAVDRALVHVEVVSSKAKLGPVKKSGLVEMEDGTEDNLRADESEMDAEQDEAIGQPVPAEASAQ